MLREFNAFLMRNNILALVLAVVIGTALATVIGSLVEDVIMPPVGLALGGVDFQNLYWDLSGKGYPSLAAAKEAGAPTINYGNFINTVIVFIIVAFVVFLISAFAETNRVPFDLPEAETELVAGFHTEYSALKFALFFMAEYVNMFTVSVMCVTLFLGGWYVPGLGRLLEPGSIPYAVVSHLAFIGKICAFLFLYIWVRGTLPRFRFDQLMNFGWKFLLPLGIANIILTIVIVYFMNR